MRRWVAVAAFLVSGITASAQGTSPVDAPIESSFFASQGAHFTVLFEGPADEELARHAVDLLDDAYFQIGAALHTFPDRVITVVLYTQQQFRDVTHSPEWAAGAYDGKIHVPMRGALQQPVELRRVLTHELTHALVQNLAPRGVPTWLHEGLAVFFESSGNSGWADAQLAGSRERLSLQQLSGGFSQFSTEQGQTAYAQSAVAVRRLIEEFGTTAVVALLQDIGQGERIDAAFERRMLVPYDTVVNFSR